MTTSVPIHDRLVCRLPEDVRRRCLDAIRPGTTVLVEHSWSRKLDDASSLVGEVLGVAYSPGGGASDALVIRPASPGLRLHAISAAHVLRVRMATVRGFGPASPSGVSRVYFKAGEVLVGPPVTTA